MLSTLLQNSCPRRASTSSIHVSDVVLRLAKRGGEASSIFTSVVTVSRHIYVFTLAVRHENYLSIAISTT
jgi:hypothetical protein